MNGKRLLLVGSMAFLAAALGSCSLLPSTPTAFQFPTPNWTMSKLFEVPSARPRTTASARPLGTESPPPTATISPTAPDCTNAAQFVGETVPAGTRTAPGSAFMKTWTLKNVGTCLWGRGYALAFDHGDPMGGAAVIPLTAAVPAGAVYTFAVNLIAPSSEGEYTGYWMLQTPQAVRFGVGTDGKTPFTVSIAVTQSPACTARDERPMENGSPIRATYAASPPVLDAKLTEWEEPLSFPVSYIPVGETDNGARLGARWDRQYLYLAVQVVDSVFAQETSGAANLLQGDALEILFDADLRGDYCDSMMSGDDYELGISPGYLPDPSLQSPTGYLFYPLGKKGSVEVSVSAALTKAPDRKGWILETRLPWTFFGISPKGGESYGFVFSVADNDQTGTVHQDGMLSTSPRRTTPLNPVLWGTLQIIADTVH
jgi:hypothetical protein